MARKPTTFSRVSSGYKDSKNTLAESGYDFGCIDGYVAGTLTNAGGYTGTTGAFTSTLSANGAATFQSTVSSRAVGTFTGLLNRSNLTQTSNATFGAGVTVDSLCSFLSNVTIGGGLTVRSNATFQASDVTISRGLTVDSGSTFNSALTVKGTLTAASALVQSLATFSSGVTVGGGLTASAATTQGGIAVGTGGRIVEISTATGAVSLGAIAPLESSSVQTVAVSGATRGDLLLLTLDSLYPNAAGNTDVTWNISSSSTAGECHIWGVNSTLTSVTPTANTVVRIVRMNFASYL